MTNKFPIGRIKFCRLIYACIRTRIRERKNNSNKVTSYSGTNVNVLKNEGEVYNHQLYVSLFIQVYKNPFNSV